MIDFDQFQNDLKQQLVYRGMDADKAEKEATIAAEILADKKEEHVQ